VIGACADMLVAFAAASWTNPCAQRCAQQLKDTMVVIRLARAGTKKKPFYRVVVADQRSPRDGRFIEQIGTYDPRVSANGVSLQLARVDHWVGHGAKASETVGQLIAKARAAAPQA
jgi:small subunit ribosomal protein S16